MSDAPERKRRFRLWITLSEAVGVLALVIAGLNFWESHHERVVDDRRTASSEQARQAAHSALVLSATVDDKGQRLNLQPMNPAQAVQSQRYLFPHAVLDHAMEVSAAHPQIDLDWLASGLASEVERQRKAGGPADGEASLPAGVYTSYVEDGDLHTDQSLYRLGYSWRSRLFGGPAIALQGLSLVRRSLPGSLRQSVEQAWSRDHPASGR